MRGTHPVLADLEPVDPDNHPNATRHYGLLWWNNADESMPDVPMDAYFSWGLGESLIIVVPSLDLVVARAGGSWSTNWSSDYTVLEPFFTPICEAVALPEPRLGSSWLASSILLAWLARRRRRTCTQS
ncbi:MAG: hypothetical protein ACREI7_02250 [Myxococcota bacterium]